MNSSTSHKELDELYAATVTSAANKKENIIRNNMYDLIHIQTTIQCCKCKKTETTHGCDDFQSVDTFVKKGWYATPTKAYCNDCNPVKIIRSKK